MLAHYIYTRRPGQYKRLFEFSVGLLENYYKKDDWPVRCIDHTLLCSQDTGGLLCSQDTGGFALAVWAEGRLKPIGITSQVHLGDIPIHQRVTGNP
ncbi:hypothetical protein [Pseudomonas sp. S9]|uniref:hypothetical protein n=1 Tax=Pseudomonas sp. S9 TaxID=686578 RepID=UPI0002556779|nr:hypothetical protein [Pseudomonas sp. S9]